MPFGNFGACFGAFCFKAWFAPPAAHIAASVISAVYIYSTTGTIVSTIYAAPLYNPIGVIIAAGTAGSIMCCVASRNRSSIRNKLNLKVRGIRACEPSHCLPFLLCITCVCFAPHLPARPRRTAGRTMPRHDRALLLHGLRRVPRVPRAQGHTWRKHGRESLQPHVIDEVRHRAGLARLALLRVVRGLAARRPRSAAQLRPSPRSMWMCGCRPVRNLCGPPWSEL